MLSNFPNVPVRKEGATQSTRDAWHGIVVDSVAEMQALRGLRDGTPVRTKGYAAIGDGRAGEYYFSATSTATANGGTVIAPTVGTGRMLLITSSGPLSVAWFGAKGDGTTDDTAAITAAISAAGANSVVLFEPGKTYKTTSLITIPADGVTLWGYGATITSALDTQFRKFLFSGRSRGAVLGLRFNCLYTSATTGIGQAVIEIGDSSDIVVRECEFNDVAKSGVWIVGNCTRCDLERNRFYRNFCAIFCDDDTVNQPTRLRIVGNRIRTGIASSSTSLSGGIKLSGTGNAYSSPAHQIEGNEVVDAGQVGIEFQGSINDCAITGNTVYGGEIGISSSGCLRTSMTGNTVRAATYACLEFAAGSHYGVASGNTVDGRNTAGTWISENLVAVDGSDTVAVTGNALIEPRAVAPDAGNAGVYVVDSDFTSIVGNQITLTRSTARPNAVRILLGNHTSIKDNVVTGNGVFTQIDNGGSADIRGFHLGGNKVQINGGDAIFLSLVPNGGFKIYDVVVTGNDINGSFFTSGIFGFSGSGASAVVGLLVADDNSEAYTDRGSANGQSDFYFIRTLTSATTLNSYDRLTKVDATAGNVTVTLPSAVGNALLILMLVRTDASGNTVTIDAAGAETINGALTQALAGAYSKAVLRSDGANWLII